MHIEKKLFKFKVGKKEKITQYISFLYLKVNSRNNTTKTKVLVFVLLLICLFFTFVVL